MDPSSNIHRKQRNKNSAAKVVGEFFGNRFKQSTPVENDMDVPIPKRKKESVHLNTPKAPNIRMYSMNGERRGQVVIFNQLIVDKKCSMDVQHSPEMDIGGLYGTLPLLGFQEKDIELFCNVSRSEIETITTNLETEDCLKKSDCLMVIILTHGGKYDTLMLKDGECNLFEFLKNFTPTNLPSMAGKPKICIIETCPGIRLNPDGQLTKPIEPDSGKTQMDLQMGILSYPEFADFLIVENRHRDDCSIQKLLIKSLSNAIESCDVENDCIYDILTQAIHEISQGEQGPTFFSSLTKKLVFRSKK